jgi:hypothetical protein
VKKQRLKGDHELLKVGTVELKDHEIICTRELAKEHNVEPFCRCSACLRLQNEEEAGKKKVEG